MTKKERATLREAAAIIKREMLEGRPVRIPGFGKFYTGQISFHRAHPMGDDFGLDRLRYRSTVRFRPFSGLREAFPTYCIGDDFKRGEVEGPVQRRCPRPFFQF